MIGKKLFISSLFLIPVAQGWGQSATSEEPAQANYELADRFHEFTLGGKFSRNSMTIFPNEINGTDNFWFEFHTVEGKNYYYVMPAAGKREPLFDKGKMAVQLSELTKGVVDRNKLDISFVEFSKDQHSFGFDYKGNRYNYNRLTGKVSPEEKKKEEEESSEPIYSWMNFSPDKKYILYAKEHNLYIKGMHIV